MSECAYAGNLRGVLAAFRAHLERTRLLPPGASVIVGWSGGADSTALLLLLHESGFEPIAAHLDHGQRPESEAESARLKRVADAWAIPFAGGRADVPEIARVRRIGLEEAGREARYSFLESVRSATGGDFVATGHTRTDQAETVLFRLARGAGLGGVGGIPERRDRIVRPLLPFSREETEEFCRARGWTPLRDPSNDDLRHARVRIRAEAMPALRAINHAAEEAIARFASRAREEDAFLDAAAAAGLERAERPLHPRVGFVARDAEIAFDRLALAHLPPVLLRRAVRLAAATLGGSLDEAQTERLSIAIVRAERAGFTAAGGRVTASVEGAKVLFRDLLAPVPARFPLAPGVVESEEFGWRMELSAGGGGGEDALSVEIDAAAIRGGLHLRTADSSDSLRRAGDAAPRRISALMKSAGVPLSVRRQLPIVADLLGPLWVPGVARAERGTPASGSARILRVTFGPLASGPSGPSPDATSGRAG